MSKPSVVRTAKAERRAQAAAGGDATSGQASSELQERTTNAEKRAEWRKARLKSLENDLLEAEMLPTIHVQDSVDGGENLGASV